MGGHCSSKGGQISDKVFVFFMLLLSSKFSLANYIGSPIKVATSLVVEENKIESYLDRTTRTTSTPTRPTSSTTATTSRTTTTRSDLGTQLLIVNSLSQNKDKQFEDIVNDVLASQSAPLDLMFSASEMHEDSNLRDDFSDENNYLTKISSKPYIFKNKYMSQHQQQEQEEQHLQQQQKQHKQQPDQDSIQTTQVPYKTTYMPFKPTGSPLKPSSDFQYDQPVSSVNKWNHLENSGPELSKTTKKPYKPIGSGTWLTTAASLTADKPVQKFGSGYKPIYAEIRPTVKTTVEVSSGPRPNTLDIIAHNSAQADFPELISTSEHTHFDGSSNSWYNDEENYLAPKPMKPTVSASIPGYAEISSTSKTTQADGSIPWLIKSSQQSATITTAKPETHSTVEPNPSEMNFNLLTVGQDTVPELEQPPGLPQYDPASVTQVPALESEPSSLVTPVSYKPTFKPFVPEANDTQFVVDNDFILEEVSEEDEEGVTVQPYVANEENDVAETLMSTATMLAEKFDFVQMSESATKYINQLSNNSLVNMVVIFGLPIITAVLSVMGAGPLAIATTAWIVPIAAIFVLPDMLNQ